MVDTKPSKTARKREQQILQDLGEQLVRLGPDELDELPLDDRLREAIALAQRIKSNGAQRRQRQYITKLMRQLDLDPIRAALARVTSRQVADKRQFARCEAWRDRIVDEGQAAIDALHAETGCERAELESLLGELQRSQSDEAQRAVRRRIFRTINGVLVAKTTDDRISQ